MPASRPQASFEPISPHYDLHSLVENNKNFEYAARISMDKIEEGGLAMFERLVSLHVIQGGKPLVIDGLQNRFDPWLFTTKWLIANHGSKQENAWNLTTQENIPVTIGHYLKNMAKLANQFFERPDSYKDKKSQRVYLKDIDCPPVWQEQLREHIPQILFYWNDGTGELGGAGALDEDIPGVGRRKGRGIAPSGDLMSSLPQAMRAENLMCYIGHEGTYTPAHKEMCASLGHNIMVNTSSTFDEDGQPEKPGSSIWFMTETKDRHIVSEYWLTVLGHDIEIEKHFAQVAAWRNAPFKVYVVEQRVGDFILIPPLAAHQVWNRGTRTMKVAWNRTTVETLEMALNEALPNARMVCRDEQYKNKAIVYYTLQKYSRLLSQARLLSMRSAHESKAIGASCKVRQVQKDFRRLFELFKKIMLSESFGPSTLSNDSQPEFLEYDSNVACSYCRGNIFNRFLTCKTCVDFFNTGIDEPYDLCMDCFVMGRCCRCQSKYKWVEQWHWKNLLAEYEEWRHQILEMDCLPTDKIPLPLEEERKLLQKKTLAQVCNEQLEIRPWVDIKKKKRRKGSGEQLDDELELNKNGTMQKTRKKTSNNTKNCHSCRHHHPKWMMTECTMCERGWCYGVLWRAYDMHPLSVMEDLRWECPHCQRICSAGACRKSPRQSPYELKGTLLGHDTRKVADVRSIECLVDFEKANLNHLGVGVDRHLSNTEMRLLRPQWETELARHKGMEKSCWDEYNDHLPYGDDDFDSTIGEVSVPDRKVSTTRSSDTFMAIGHEESLHYGGGNDNSNGYRNPAAAMLRTVKVATSAISPVSNFSKTKRHNNGDGDFVEQIKLVTSKKLEVADKERSLAKNKANWQYLLPHENSRLEQARREGRYIQVLASLKGLECVVKLTVNGEKLREIVERPSTTNRVRSSHKESATSMVLQSNISLNVAAPSTYARNDEPNSTKKFKIRDDDDDDDHDDAFDGACRRRAKKNQRYEEIDIDSEDEDKDNESQYHLSVESRSKHWTRKHRNAGDEELSNELLSTTKNSSSKRQKRKCGKKQSVRRKKMPFVTESLKIRSPIRASPGGISTLEIGRRHKNPSKAEAEASNIELARAAMKMHENLYEKLRDC
ncbi:uncharacterized protein PV09_03891 [Verruconis gallopava]|uniref:JmjC domain-containing protein n=1 Tax=Verruconis gallopava TaxID=253628 RepID=A0A0D2AFU8_9PEZI|nr:uncharacterized protein PV09_03891 [Verruconis gallopava]KIW05375.1 hypothetical protein PV09_03891 [Verruconis gallopava]